MKFEVNSSHLFRYASELDPTDDQKVRKYRQYTGLKYS